VYCKADEQVLQSDLDRMADWKKMVAEV